MNSKRIYYSCSTWLSYEICQRYYGQVHYAWCAPYFDACSPQRNILESKERCGCRRPSLLENKRYPTRHPEGGRPQAKSGYHRPVGLQADSGHIEPVATL